MIVYSLLYLCNFHYFQDFVIARAHCKWVYWMLQGVMWINKLSIYLSNNNYKYQKWSIPYKRRHQNRLSNCCYARAVFNCVESISWLIKFCITSFCDWSIKRTSPSQPIGFTIKIIRDSGTCVSYLIGWRRRRPSF